MAEIVWQFINRHTVDARRAFVPAYLLQSALQVAAFENAGQQRLELNRLGMPRLSSDDFILRCARSQLAPVVRCVAVPLHWSALSFIVKTFSGATRLSGRRRRACALASVRRSNCTCGFPACSFHEGAWFRVAIEGINPTRFTSPNSP